jgi:hypothetical protein
MRLISLGLVSLLWLTGCGGGDTNTATAASKAEQAPVIKWVSEGISLDALTEGQSLSIPYNIIDPDSSAFTIQVSLPDFPELALNIDQDNRQISFMTPFTDGDVTSSMIVYATDDTGLSSNDTLAFTIKESHNDRPTIAIRFEQERYLQEDEIVVLYALNADDPDGSNDTLVTTQAFYSEDPRICLPVCLPVPFTVVQYRGRYAATLTTTLTAPETQFWLFASTADPYGFTEDVASFFVEKKDNTAPRITVAVEQEIIHKFDPALFAYNLHIEDLDNAFEDISVIQTIYSDDPTGCRPICVPLSVTWLQYEDRHVASFTPTITQLDTPFWLDISATDGLNTTEKIIPFIVSESAPIAPTIDIVLEKTLILESEGLVLPYDLRIIDPDTAETDRSLTQTVYDEDPRTCRPICLPIPATWLQHNSRHALTLQTVLSEDTDFWLAVEVSDGTSDILSVAKFSAQQSLNTPPTLSITLESETVQQTDNVMLPYDLQLHDTDEVTVPVSLTQTVYRDNPAFCRPICVPISASWLLYNTRHVAVFSPVLTEQRTSFWLNVIASDGVNNVEQHIPFTVQKAP